MIGLKGNVKGIAEVSKAIGKAPDQFRKSMLGALLSERGLFVGDRSRDGVFTKKLMRKTGVSGRKWPRNVARIFGGRVENGDRLEGMKLIMGVGESKRTTSRHRSNYGVGVYTGIPFLDVLDFLQTGGYVRPQNSTYMIVPIYRNLPTKGKTRKQWEFMKDNHLLEYVREGNRIYYFKKDGYGDDRDLMFIGILGAFVNRQYNFYGDWNRRLPSSYKRIQKRIDRAVEKINRS